MIKAINDTKKETALVYFLQNFCWISFVNFVVIFKSATSFQSNGQSKITRVKDICNVIYLPIYNWEELGFSSDCGLATKVLYAVLLTCTF